MSQVKGSFPSPLPGVWGAKPASSGLLSLSDARFPSVLAQVVYGVKEYARTAVDMISRRTRLAFLNVQAAEEALPRIVDIMGKELNWCEQKKKVQRAFSAGAGLFCLRSFHVNDPSCLNRKLQVMFYSRESESLGAFHAKDFIE